MDYIFAPFDILHRIYSGNKDPFELKRLEKGEKYTKETHCIIGSLLRDAEPSFEYSKKLIKKFSKIFKTLDVIILENDSKDNTNKLWKDFSKNHKMKNTKIFIESPKKDYYPPTVDHDHSTVRINKMVKLRNDLLKTIREKSRKFSYEKYIFITDLDIKGRLETKGIYDTFYYFSKTNKKKNKYDAIGCNGLLMYHTFYFDSYAYQRNSKIHSKVHSGIDVPINEGLFDVLSSFSGGVFYKYDKLISLKYKLKKKDGVPICEHITINSKLNMSINTNMKYYIDKH